MLASKHKTNNKGGNIGKSGIQYIYFARIYAPNATGAATQTLSVLCPKHHWGFAIERSASYFQVNLLQVSFPCVKEYNSTAHHNTFAIDTFIRLFSGLLPSMQSLLIIESFFYTLRSTNKLQSHEAGDAPLCFRAGGDVWWSFQQIRSGLFSLFVCKQKDEKWPSLLILTIQFGNCLLVHVLDIIKMINWIIITYEKHNR